MFVKLALFLLHLRHVAEWSMEVLVDQTCFTHSAGLQNEKGTQYHSSGHVSLLTTTQVPLLNPYIHTHANPFPCTERKVQTFSSTNRPGLRAIRSHNHTPNALNMVM